MPGEIVATNGTLVDDQRVEWTFEAVQAYPFGYPMRCRSLAPNDETQQELLGGTPLATRADMLAYLQALNSDFVVAEAMRNCAKQHSLAPLFAARDRTLQEGGDVRPYDTIARLLGLSDRLADVEE
jgi:hypothetical protein